MLYLLFIGFPETVMIIIISLLVFGPKKIPEIARGLAQGIRAMRTATDDIKREIMKPVDEVVKSTDEGVKGYKDSLKKHLDDDVLTDVKNQVNKIKDDLSSKLGSIKRD